MTSPTMDLQEAANTLKVHPHTLEKMIRAGDIPAGKLGRSYLLLTRDVLAYAEKIILKQTADRLNQRRPATKAARRGPSRAGLRSASASGGFCAL
ncbi:helix-turn-helix domain-containing protein [Diaphorobacter sp. ED-3]|uniref:helix-turn-helix domain-containing protein n=1 Tax=Diaphorobacter sp. ED-3 TaxID=3016636 RepID=UPI0022DDCFFA|nr:helix-turn-helix domain-containing protein [Diaphorobacter sp. ED-3]